MRLTGVPYPTEPVALGDGLVGRVVTSVVELTAAGMDDLPGGPMWTTPAWWQFVEADDDHEVCYLLIEDPRRRPLAVAPAMLIRGTRNLLFYNGPRILGDFATIGSMEHVEPNEREALPALAAEVDKVRESFYPSLTVGVFGANFGLRPFTAQTPFSPERLVPAVARFADILAARWDCASLALLFLDGTQDHALRENATRLGLRRVVFGGEAVLEVPSGDIEDYLRTLPTRRRTVIRREMRAYAELGLSTRIEEGPRALTDEYLALRSALRAKYGHQAGVGWARREFAALREHAGHRLVVFSARDSERVIGYCMTFRVGDELYPRAAGFDYEASAGAFCYFNLAYYDVIRWAQREGVRRIHYGLGATAAKHYRGCSLVPRWAYLRFPANAPSSAHRLLEIQRASATRLLSVFARTAEAASGHSGSEHSGRVPVAARPE